jgi:hypothetical protein
LGALQQGHESDARQPGGVDLLWPRPRYQGKAQPIAWARKLGIGRRLMGRVAANRRLRQWGRLDFRVLHWNPAHDFCHRLGIEHRDEWALYRAQAPPRSIASPQRIGVNNIGVTSVLTILPAVPSLSHIILPLQIDGVLMPLDKHTRTENGRLRRERNDSTAGTLRQDYPEFANRRSDAQLGNIKKDLGLPADAGINKVRKALREE